MATGFSAWVVNKKWDPPPPNHPPLATYVLNHHPKKMIFWSKKRFNRKKCWEKQSFRLPKNDLPELRVLFLPCVYDRTIQTKKCPFCGRCAFGIFRLFGINSSLRPCSPPCLDSCKPSRWKKKGRAYLNSFPSWVVGKNAENLTHRSRHCIAQPTYSKREFWHFCQIAPICYKYILFISRSCTHNIPYVLQSCWFSSLFTIRCVLERSSPSSLCSSRSRGETECGPPPAAAAAAARPFHPWRRPPFLFLLFGSPSLSPSLLCSSRIPIIWSPLLFPPLLSRGKILLRPPLDRLGGDSKSVALSSLRCWPIPETFFTNGCNISNWFGFFLQEFEVVCGEKREGKDEERIMWVRYSSSNWIPVLYVILSPTDGG